MHDAYIYIDIMCDTLKHITSVKVITILHISFPYFLFLGGFFYVRYSTLRHLPPFRCHSVGAEDVGVEPRTVATFSLTAMDALATRLDLIHSRLDFIHTQLDLIPTRLDLIHYSARSLPLIG
jgi:hypothetical protein